MAKLTVEDLELKGKKVLMRVDFNVPLKEENGEVVVSNDNRIVAALPTIKYVLDNGGRAILFSHLGRIKSEDDKKGLSMKPVAQRLADLLGQPVTFVPATEGKELEDAIAGLEDGQVLIFENTRFEDVVNGEEVKRESKNDPELGKYWASLGDVFVNDAFGTAHRAHASNVGIASNIAQTAAGFLMEKEIKFLGGAVENPERPFVAIIGGAKVSDKIKIIENLLKMDDM
ncbi:MAG: phosphoglycerate kinase, partial [Weissella confusa]